MEAREGNEMKKNPRIGQRIKKFREDHYASQKALADALGLGQTVVSAWETGDNVPSCEAWVKLASVAPSPDNLFFLRQAGLDREIIIAAAKTLKENTVIRPKEGDMVQIPRYRYTEKGREEAGPPVRLEPEFVPNPEQTICLLVDEKSPRIGDCPRGLIFIDTSIEGRKWRDEFSGRVVMLDYMPKDVGPWPLGLYMGRIFRHGPGAQLPRAIWFDIMLETLTEEGAREVGRWLPVGHYTETAEALAAVQGDKEKSEALVNEFRQRAASSLCLGEGVRILGKVIGRLTGHLEKG
jgi:transcriptional regulator with XRE-family HTH domain